MSNNNDKNISSVWIVPIIVAVIGATFQPAINHIIQQNAEKEKDRIQKEEKAKQQIQEHREKVRSLELQNTEKLYKVFVQNNCLKTSEIGVAITYQALDGEWMTDGWWSIPANEIKKIEIKTKNPNVYFYAEDSSGHIWGGQRKQNDVDRKVTNYHFPFIAFGSYPNEIRFPIQDELWRLVNFSHVQISRFSEPYTRTFVCN